MAPLNELDKVIIIPAIFASVTAGACAESKIFEEQLQDIQIQTHNTYSFSKEKREALDELHEVASETAAYNWDGYGARAMDIHAYDRTKRFLQYWPEELPFPEIGVMPEGDISLDWDFARRRSLTVLIGAENRITYAMINLDDEKSGTLSFIENTPKPIISSLKELLEAC